MISIHTSIASLAANTIKTNDLRSTSRNNIIRGNRFVVSANFYCQVN
ncbi:hypothetical protein H1R81_08810 [Emticicia sp. BO119]|nr:hypothetical protein [Emticicia sp. BO119]